METTTISTELLKKLLTAATDVNGYLDGFKPDSDEEMKTLDSVMQEVESCIRRKSFNIQITSLANLTTGETDVTSEWTITPNSEKTEEEVNSDIQKWKEMCEELKEEEPDCDDEYILLFEKLGYSVESINFKECVKL